MHLLFLQCLQKAIWDELDDVVYSALTSRSFKLLGFRKARIGISGQIMDSFGFFFNFPA